MPDFSGAFATLWRPSNPTDTFVHALESEKGRGLDFPAQKLRLLPSTT